MPHTKKILTETNMNIQPGQPGQVIGTLNILLCLVLLISLSACGSNQSKPMSVNGNIQAMTILNPDVNGEYRPVNIKVYYLKSEKAFSQGSFKDLYQHPDKALGNSVLHVSSHQLLPGQMAVLSEKVPQGMKYIGVVAAFRHIQDAKWKDIKPIPEKCFMCSGPGLWDPITITAQRLSIHLDTGNESNQSKDSQEDSSKPKDSKIKKDRKDSTKQPESETNNILDYNG